ncbi:hypothetical protein [Salinibius halmophilus]|uniref:hypothetical protein n=1 Tax=Salinibius halmophilus TaxID=1853216 RepID=UPI000E66D2E5|nr:hypothetical protein [Salinibius halmophilus]
MNTGALGPLRMVSGPLDFSGSTQTKFDKETLAAIARLQKQDTQLTSSRYEIIKHNGINDDVAFMDGVTKVENIEDYLQGLVNRAEKQGGEDGYGVKTKQYAQLAEAKGIFVDFEV